MMRCRKRLILNINIQYAADRIIHKHNRYLQQMLDRHLNTLSNSFAPITAYLAFLTICIYKNQFHSSESTLLAAFIY